MFYLVIIDIIGFGYWVGEVLNLIILIVFLNLNVYENMISIFWWIWIYRDGLLFGEGWYFFYRFIVGVRKV